jgi:hypothetical protein
MGGCRRPSPSTLSITRPSKPRASTEAKLNSLKKGGREMSKGCRLCALTLALMVAFGVPVYGWDNLGHMTVAATAYRRLTPAKRDRVDALLKLNPDRPNWLKLIPPGTPPEDQRMMVFMIAATWPDRIKSDSHYSDDGTENGNRPDGVSSRLNIGYPDLLRHKYWHFVDEPFTQDGTKLAPVPTPNALTQIAAFRAVLASNKSDALKSYDLSWLLHLVGDVHQPLHGTARFGKTQRDGDAGGNLVQVCAPACGVRLHAFWDDILGTSDSPTDALAVADALPPAPAQLADLMDTAKWIDESFQSARQSVYVTPIGLGKGPFNITPAYRGAALALARKRVALAGARLANILNNELK